MCGTENARIYRGSFGALLLKLRDISDFDTNAKIMGFYGRLASNASGVEKVALTQAHNKAGGMLGVATTAARLRCPLKILMR